MPSTLHQPVATEETKPVEQLRLGSHTLHSRLIVGTGKYANYKLMAESLDASGTDCITVAVRRERLIDAQGQNLLDHIDTRAIHFAAQHGRLLHRRRCGSASPDWAAKFCWAWKTPAADWVKLEVLGDTKTLLPDPIATLEATERLVADGFQVLCYTTDDPMTARRLKQAGATSVMPAGSPIGSGQGILNPNNIRICLEYLKDGDPDYPVIVDAGRRHRQRREHCHGAGRGRPCC